VVQRDRETERQRDRETERQRDRETERKETERQRDRRKCPFTDSSHKVMPIKAGAGKWRCRATHYLRDERTEVEVDEARLGRVLRDRVEQRLVVREDLEEEPFSPELEDQLLLHLFEKGGHVRRVLRVLVHHLYQHRVAQLAHQSQHSVLGQRHQFHRSRQLYQRHLLPACNLAEHLPAGAPSRVTRAAPRRRAPPPVFRGWAGKPARPPSTWVGTRRVHLVRGLGRDVSV